MCCLLKGRRWVVLSHPHDGNEGVFESTCPLDGRYDAGPAAVVDQAVIRNAERLGEPWGVFVILVRHLLVVHHRPGIEVGPSALSHSDLFPGLGSRVKLVHGAPCGEGVSRGRPEVAEDGRIPRHLREHAVHAVS